DKLASDPQGYRADGQVRGSGHAKERVVVALGGGPEGETLIRRAARIAERSGGDLLAVHAAPPGPPAAAPAPPAPQPQLIRSLGGTYHQLADTDIPAALLAFAHAENATQLVLGATHSRWPSALRPRTTIRSQVIRRGGGLDVHIITCTPAASGVPPAA